MTKKLEDLIERFSDMSAEQKLKKIQSIRTTRNIERPSTAKKRVVKEGRQAEKKKTSAKNLILNLSPEDKAALLAKLTGEDNG